jgi:hypothetical protein
MVFSGLFQDLFVDQVSVSFFNATIWLNTPLILMQL